MILSIENIESILPKLFVLLLFAPLPLLLFYAIFQSLIQEFVGRVQYNNVKKYYPDFTLLTLDQLEKLYPGRNNENLEDLFDDLSERNFNITHRLETRRNKKALNKQLPTLVKIR
jgi:hypothetical protein